MFTGLKKLLGGKSSETKNEEDSGVGKTTIGQTIGGPTVTRPMKRTPKISKEDNKTLPTTTTRTKDLTSSAVTLGSSRLVVTRLKEDTTEPTTTTTNSSGFSVKPKIDKNTELSKLLEDAILVKSATPKEEEIATIFSEGHDKQALDTIKAYFKEKMGNVESRIWFMLLDIYQIQGETQEFDKTALAFSQAFGTSPPSWFGPKNNLEQKENIGNGKNMIILDSIMKPDFAEKFKELLKAAKQEKFCRINISQCKFEQNNIELFEKFLKLLQDLRKAKISSVLMGDNNLINFCQRFFKDEKLRNNLAPGFLENEIVIWQLYLEILQWKGQSEEFDNIALDYADKFEVSPPGWEDSGVMLINQSVIKEETSNSNFVAIFDKDLNGNNINTLLSKIDKDFETKNHSVLDLSLVNRIDFSAAGSITYHIQELWADPSNMDKKVIIKYPNELVTVLLQMLGVTEVVSIIPRNRK